MHQLSYQIKPMFTGLHLCAVVAAVTQISLINVKHRLEIRVRAKCLQNIKLWNILIFYCKCRWERIKLDDSSKLKPFQKVL